MVVGCVVVGIVGVGVGIVGAGCYWCVCFVGVDDGDVLGVIDYLVGIY